MEKLLLSANAQQTGTLFSAVRYGNVFGSRGSVVETFLKQVKEQFQMYGSGVHPVLTITDKDMTRFWITLSKGVDFVISRLIDTSGGKIYIPKLPTVKVFDLAKAIACNCTFNIIGIRPGEKLHEVMVSKDEIVRATDINDYISISAELSHKPLKAEYNSGTNKQILTQEEIALMLSTYETEKEYSK
jgi:UDP-N-acetylglucosamine 4,6-dehydratase